MNARFLSNCAITSPPPLSLSLGLFLPFLPPFSSSPSISVEIALSPGLPQAKCANFTPLFFFY